MQNFLVVGDLQMKRENLQVCAALFDQVESLAKERKVNSVIWLGDMLDRRGLVEAECLNALFDYFNRSALWHHIVIGNHDLLSMHHTAHSLEPLKAVKNVKIYDRPALLAKNCLVMPYYKNPQKFLQEIDSLFSDLNPNPILICHQGIKQFTVNSGYTEEEAVELKDLQMFKLVIAGHYHTPKTKDNTVYLGSPFSHSFGESNEQKRLGVLEVDSGQLEFIDINFRKHMTYNLDLDEENHVVPQFDLQNINRIIIKGSEKKIEDFKKLPVTPGVKYIFISTGERAAAISETLTNKEKWIKWSRDIKKLNEEYVNAGLELLND
jgi:DNA repair exonuclease SbcCD nuclease subunit